MRKVAVFGSGDGSNFEAIVKYFKNKPHEIEFICVSDKENAPILSMANNLNIENYYLSFEETEKFLMENRFDLIILTGYMSVLSPEILKLGIFINIHPSLLPAYNEVDAIRQAFEAGEKITGITIHIVSEKIDKAPIIAQQAVSIPENTTLKELEHRILEAENYLYPQIIEEILFTSGSGCSSGGSCGCSHSKDKGNGCSGCGH